MKHFMIWIMNGSLVSSDRNHECSTELKSLNKEVSYPMNDKYLLSDKLNRASYNMYVERGNDNN